MAKIDSMKIKNFKNIKFLEYNPKGYVIRVGGMNGSGKTSLLESFIICMGGKKIYPGKPVRDGALESEIEYKFDNGLIANLRHFSKPGKDPILTVKQDDKRVIGGAQTTLRSLYHEQLIDPTRFIDLPPKEQVKVFKEMLGLDFSEKDKEREELYDERTLVNRDIERAIIDIDNLDADEDVPDEDEDVPDEEIDVSELMGKLHDIAQYNDETKANNRAIVECERNIKRNMTVISKADKEIAELNNKIEELENSKKETFGKIKEMKQEKARLEEVVASRDTEEDSKTKEKEIKEKIKNAGRINTQVQKKKRKAGMEEALRELQAESSSLTQKINHIDQWKVNQIAECHLPYPGLTFDTEELFLNGIPFQQEAQSKKICIAVHLLFNLLEEKCGEGAIKVVLLMNAPYLDEINTYARLEEIAKKANGQIFVEEGGDGDNITFYMRDGEAEERQPVEK